MPIIHTMTVNVTITQPGLTVDGVVLTDITQEALVTFGEWIKGDPGPAGPQGDVDFTHTANTPVSGNFSAIFAADERDTVMVTTSADLSVSITCNNDADNYIWVSNSGAADIDILISSVTRNGSPVTNIYLPADGISVPAGHVCEIGVVCNADGAFITSRNDLKL